MENGNATRDGGGAAGTDLVAGTEGGVNAAADGGDVALAERRALEIVEERLAAFREDLGRREREERLEKFSGENPAFRELAANGKLEEYKRKNPLLDDFGAYFAHRLEEERAGLAGKIEQAVAAAEERMLAQFKAKRLAATMDSGPGPAKDGGIEPELARPEKFGGLNAVIAARLKARREAAGS
jgi:hypothetical protein